MNESERFQRLEALFHELDALDPLARASRLADLAESAPELHAELQAMFPETGEITARARAIDALGEVSRGSERSVEDPTEIGPYTLLERLGEGGMGRVYRAEQSQPVQRSVALKLMRRGLDGSDAVARFLAERQALAVLDHPHIARVFDAGSTADGRPWFAMEYIEGEPITRWASQRGLGLEERIRLLLPVCEAVQHAHRKGLIHRDLKPSNILVMNDGGRGFAKVIDFGIARLIDPSGDGRSQVTQLGELIGTPEYMSPEQAALGAIDIDTRSDVYSLGLVLYELLVGALPLSGRRLRALGFEAMCREIREGDTPRPSRFRAEAEAADPVTARWRARLRGDLDSVLLKALAKDREQRYGSASELGDDLKRYLDNQPVRAQPPSLRYRAGKFIRRHRWPVAMAASLSLALIVGVAAASYGLVEARRAQAQALAAADVAQQEAERALAQQQEAERQYELANAYLLGQRVYLDLLMEQFSGEDGGVALTERLMESWRQQHANRVGSEDAAAAMALALGRNFYFRRDYRSAHEVFETWLEADYGSAAMRAAGRELYASSLADAGQRDAALPMLRQVLGDMEAGARRSAVDRFNVAMRIAQISREPDDIATAETLYGAREAEMGVDSQNPYQQIENMAGLMNIRRMQGDLAGSATVLERMHALYSEHEGLVQGRNIVRARLAELWLFDQARAADTEALTRLIAGEDLRTFGENPITARGWYLLARALLEQSRLDEARAALDEAQAMQARVSGGSGELPDYALTRMLLALAAEDPETAGRWRDDLVQRRNSAQLPAPWHETVALAELYFEAHAGATPAQALRDRLPARPTVELEALHLYRRLESGLAAAVKGAGIAH